MDVAIDNSALSELTDDSLKNKLIAAIRDRGARLVVPVVALSECLTQTDLSRVEPRARSIVALADELGASFVVGEDWHELARMEWRSRRPQRTPSLNANVVRGFLCLLAAATFREDHLERLPALRIYMAKEHTQKLDSDARTYFAEQARNPSPGDLEEILNPFAERVMGVGRYPLVPFTKSARHRARVRRAPALFPSTVMMSAYFYLIAIGSLFAGYGYGAYAWLLRGPQRGSWVDARTAASAMHASHLITNDENQAAKVNFIGEQLSHGTRAVDLNSFLQERTRKVATQ